MTGISIIHKVLERPLREKLEVDHIVVANYYMKVDNNVKHHHVQVRINEILRYLTTLHYRFGAEDRLQSRLK